MIDFETIMVSILQYLSKKTPKEFQVTDLDLQKTKDDIIKQSAKREVSSLQITLNGFYATESEKASSYAKRFERVLNNSGQFKSIDFTRSKKSERSGTHYTIKMIYE